MNKKQLCKKILDTYLDNSYYDLSAKLFNHNDSSVDFALAMILKSFRNEIEQHLEETYDNEDVGNWQLYFHKGFRSWPVIDNTNIDKTGLPIQQVIWFLLSSRSTTFLDLMKYEFDQSYFTEE